jgi:hypothetical protein
VLLISEAEAAEVSAGVSAAPGYLLDVRADPVSAVSGGRARPYFDPDQVCQFRVPWIFLSCSCRIQRFV